MSKETSSTKKTFFGLISLIAAITSILFLGAFFGITLLNISPGTFNLLNNLFALISCIFAPVAVILSVVGYRQKKDSKTLSAIAFGLVGLPYLILFGQFIFSFLK